MLRLARAIDRFTEKKRCYSHRSSRRSSPP